MLVFIYFGFIYFSQKRKKKSMIDPIELPLLYENMSIMCEN